MGLLDLFSSSQGEANARAGYDMQSDALNQAYKRGNKAQNQGYDLAQGFLEPALAPFQQMSEQGQQGIDAYGNLIGLNGAEAANEANQASPSYQFSLAQGLQALDRNHAASGNYNSGNWGADSIKYAQGLASEDYFKRAGLYQPYFGLGQAGAAGQAGVRGSQADVATNRANQLTGLAQNIGTQLGQAGYNMYGNINNAQQAANQSIGNVFSGLLGLGGSFLGGPGGGSLGRYMFGA